MAWGHTLTHLQCTFVTSTEISVNLPRSMVDGELGMARTHFKTVTLGVIAVLFTCLFLVTQKTTHTPVSYPYAGITGYMGWFITGGVILLFFHAQQCLLDHLFWGTHFSSAAPLESAVASIVPIVRHLAIHCLRYKHLSHLIPSAFIRAVTMDTRNHAHYRLTHGRRGLTSSNGGRSTESATSALR